MISNKPIITTLLFSSGLFLISCGGCDWTSEEWKQFEKECHDKTNFDYLIVDFRGFDENEFDSILVKEYNAELPIDSFKIYVEKFRDPWSKEHKSRWSKINRKLNTNYSYKFIVDSQQTFVLKNMKMIEWAQGPFCPDCTMGEYSIDSVDFYHNANPSFIKRNWSK